jgi:hypothetical protein
MNYLKFKVSREVSRFLCRSVYFFLREGNPPSKKKDTLLTNCIQKFFGARKFR